MKFNSWRFPKPCFIIIISMVNKSHSMTSCYSFQVYTDCPHRVKSFVTINTYSFNYPCFIRTTLRGWLIHHSQRCSCGVSIGYMTYIYVKRVSKLPQTTQRPANIISFDNLVHHRLSLEVLSVPIGFFS